MNRLTHIGIARDSNVNELQWSIGVAESNDGQVDIRGLSDGLERTREGEVGERGGGRESKKLNIISIQYKYF